MGQRRNHKKNQRRFQVIMNYNENTTYSVLQGAAKGILRGKFIALKAFIRKEKRYKISDLRFHLKLGKVEQSKPKVSSGKEGSDKGKSRNL